jgi:hypothetical protein
MMCLLSILLNQGLVCSIGAFKQAVKINFFQGAFLEDPQKLFNAGLDAKKREPSISVRATLLMSLL